MPRFRTRTRTNLDFSSTVKTMVLRAAVSNVFSSKNLPSVPVLLHLLFAIWPDTLHHTLNLARLHLESLLDYIIANITYTETAGLVMELWVGKLGRKNIYRINISIALFTIVEIPGSSYSHILAAAAAEHARLGYHFVHAEQRSVMGRRELIAWVIEELRRGVASSAALKNAAQEGLGSWQSMAYLMRTMANPVNEPTRGAALAHSEEDRHGLQQREPPFIPGLLNTTLPYLRSQSPPVSKPSILGQRHRDTSSNETTPTFSEPGLSTPSNRNRPRLLGSRPPRSFAVGNLPQSPLQHIQHNMFSHPSGRTSSHQDSPCRHILHGSRSSTSGDGTCHHSFISPSQTLYRQTIPSFSNPGYSTSAHQSSPPHSQAPQAAQQDLDDMLSLPHSSTSPYQVSPSLQSWQAPMSTILVATLHSVPQQQRPAHRTLDPRENISPTASHGTTFSRDLNLLRPWSTPSTLTNRSFSIPSLVSSGYELHSQEQQGQQSQEAAAAAATAPELATQREAYLLILRHFNGLLKTAERVGKPFPESFFGFLEWNAGGLEFVLDDGRARRDYCVWLERLGL